MTTKSRLTDAERKEAIAAIDAEIAQLQAERAALEPVRCARCWGEFDDGMLDRNDECYSCAREEPDGPDETEERRSEYYASIAAGCAR